MSMLYFYGKRKPGHKSLCRRYHDLSGTDYVYIASLPDETAEALCQGGALRVRLREEAGVDQAPWILDVVRDGVTYPGTLLSHDRFAVLMEEKDQLPVMIKGGELTLKKHELLLARHALERAEDAVRTAQGKVSTLALEVFQMERAETGIRLPAADGKYEVVLTEDGDAYATRYGERWRDLKDAPLTIAIARELEACRGVITSLSGKPLESGETPAHYGAARDMLRLTLMKGAEIVQDVNGKVTGTWDGKDIAGLIGDNLTLSLAYELEAARASLAHLTENSAAQLFLEPGVQDELRSDPSGPDL